MASLSTPQDAILYQNPAKTVALIDIPRSISLAQGSPSHPHTAQIFSSPALRAPFPSTEPKTEKAKLRLLKLQSQDGFGTQFPEASLRLAMEETSEGFEGKWCLERKLPADSPVRQGRKRKYGGERKQMTEAESASSVHHICSISSETQNVPGSASGGFHDPVNSMCSSHDLKTGGIPEWILKHVHDTLACKFFPIEDQSRNSPVHEHGGLDYVFYPQRYCRPWTIRFHPA